MIHTSEQSRELVEPSLFLAASKLSRRLRELSPIVSGSSHENRRADTRGERVMPQKYREKFWQSLIE